jgi:spore maturation protein SpmA
MALNYLWVGFFIISFAVGVIKLLFFQNYTVFPAMVDSTFTMAKVSVEIAIGLIGVMAFWLGIMKVGEKGGAVNALSKVVGPFFQELFPSLPKNHKAFGSILMNFSANMLGLDNAATPLGIKAMKELQEDNLVENTSDSRAVSLDKVNSDTASNAQIMFLVLNTSGLTLIPVSVMAIRATKGAASPSDVFLPILIATYFSTLAGLIAVSIYQKINLFKPKVLAYLGGATTAIFGIIWYMKSLTPEEVGLQSSLIGNAIIMSIIVSFIVLALIKKVNIYETFIEGAKEGFEVSVKIIPYLVAMLVAIGVFRASGSLDLLLDGLRWIVDLTGLPNQWVDAMPVAFMKPLSGSGARGAMTEIIQNYGVDDFRAQLAGAFQGSTETTFYTLAVYFGAVGIKRTRHALTCGLIADAAGIVAAIFIAYLFFA